MASSSGRSRKRKIYEGFVTEFSPSKSPRKDPKNNNSTKGVVIKQKPDVQDQIRTISSKLRRFLSLNKAHKWLIYEFFCSTIDSVIFGHNEFLACLQDLFSDLKSYNLRRAEWNYIRRLLGKPRRCSPNFFAEERRALYEKRNLIRLLQQTKMDTFRDHDFQDLPRFIPMPLILGAQVTARIRTPIDGLFYGEIEAIDSGNDTYRIRISRHVQNNSVVHDVCDYEVMPRICPEMVSLDSFRQRHSNRYSHVFTPNKTYLENDPMLNTGSWKTDMEAVCSASNASIFELALMAKLHSLLTRKENLVEQLREMNSDAEMKKCCEEPLMPAFQQRYASLVLELEDLNVDVREKLRMVQTHTQKLVPAGRGDTMPPPIDSSTDILERCSSVAGVMVRAMNANQGKNRVTNERNLELITGLVALLMHIRDISENDSLEQPADHHVLKQAIQRLRGAIDPWNQQKFQQCVEMHVRYIQSGLSNSDQLHGFMDRPSSTESSRRPESAAASSTSSYSATTKQLYF